MKKLEDIVVVLQARLHSERVPQKVAAPFAGTNLLDIAVEKLTKSKVIKPEQFYLSVHEPELVAIGEKYGVNIYHRSEASARAEGVPLTLLYEWWDKLPFTYAVLINPCAPLLTIETIDRFVEAYANTEADGLFGVWRKKNYIWDASGALISKAPARGEAMDTKLVEPYFEAAHSLYGGRLDLIGEGVWMGELGKPGDIELFEMEEFESFDIDYPWQFEVAENLYKASLASR